MVQSTVHGLTREGALYRPTQCFGQLASKKTPHHFRDLGSLRFVQIGFRNQLGDEFFHAYDASDEARVPSMRFSSQLFEDQLISAEHLMVLAGDEIQEGVDTWPWIVLGG